MGIPSGVATCICERSSQVGISASAHHGMNLATAITVAEWCRGLPRMSRTSLELVMLIGVPTIAHLVGYECVDSISGMTFFQ